MGYLKRILGILIIFYLPLYSQWQPLYEESMNDFCTMDFVNDSVGWVAGWGGTLIKTTDGGQTWTSMPLNPEYDIEKIDFINESVGWAVARSTDSTTYYGTIVLKTLDGGNNWFFYNYVDARLKSLFAVNDSGAYILGNSQALYKTNIEGTECLEISTGLEDSGLGSIWFFNENRGIITGTLDWEHGLIMRTYDGGLTWIDTIIYDFRSISNLKFINDSIGYFLASDHDGQQFFCETNDTLHSWSVLSIDNNRIYEYDIVNKDLFYIIAIEESDSTYAFQIKRSRDHSHSWESLYSIQNWHVTDFNITTDETGIVLVTFGRAYPGPGWSYGPTSGSALVSNNNPAEQWKIEKIVSYPLSDICFVSTNKGFISGGAWGQHYAEGGIFMTDDACKSWKQIYHSNAIINKLEFINESTGYALSSGNYVNYKLVKTIDGGINWIEIFDGGWYDPIDSTFTSFRVFDFYFKNENTSWLAGRIEADSSGAVILKTNNGGRDWYTVWQCFDAWNLNSLVFTDENNGWAVGSNGIIVKYSASRGWQTADNFTDLPLNRVYFSDENHGWIGAGYYDYNNHLLKFYKTNSAGKEWTEIKDFNYFINDMFFADSLYGWAVGADTLGKGIILHTTDGGYTWAAQVKDLNIPVRSIHFKDGYGWATGGNGEPLRGHYPRSILLETYDEGATWINKKNGTIYSQSYQLHQNYPNPFNPKTIISYTVGAHRESPIQHVDLSIYNILGQKVTTLVNKKQPAGKYEIEWNARGFASGVYYYRLQAGDFVKTRKLVHLK
jgi:photosystem II stability/assembly factor-like uncharacterized protein